MIGEILVSIYLADFITGMVHLHLDYKRVRSTQLRLHTESSIASIRSLKKTDLFNTASDEDQFLWNFHIHHDVPYPSCDSNRDLLFQILRPLSIPVALVLMLAHLSIVSAQVARIFLFSVCLGCVSQFTHFAAHARSRILIKSRLIRSLQDWHVILHPKTHQRHHEEYDCNFCILNGWANPLVNRIRQCASYFAILPREPPTLTTRGERNHAKVSTATLARDKDPPQAH